jgi:hypothetical protein
LATARSLCGEIIEIINSFRKSVDVDKDSELMQLIGRLMESMDIEEKITVKIVLGWDNAEIKFGNLKLGQILIEKINKNSLNSVLAHELAHLKRKHTEKHMLAYLIFGLLVVLSVWMTSTLPSLNSYLINFILIFIATYAIQLRFLSWSLEYEADSIGATQEQLSVFKQALKDVAAIKNMDFHRDFYRHPSMEKRINKLTSASSMIPLP